MSYKTRIATLSIICFSIILALTGWLAYSGACKYEHENEKLTDRLHTAPKVVNLLKYLAELGTFGEYEGYSKEMNELNAIISASKKYRQQANIATIAFFILSGIFSLLIYASSSDKKPFIATMLIISSIALGVGLFAPILMIVTYKDIPILGNIVFHFQSKGIITTIKMLFTSGNILVAIPLALFSVAVPFLKTLVTALALTGSGKSSTMHIIKSIGKWSMADVFVVSLLLTYFTINKDKSTNAELQIGFYFFLGYVIFSIIAASLLTRATYEGKTLFDDTGSDTDIWGEPSTEAKKADPFGDNDDDPFC